MEHPKTTPEQAPENPPRSKKPVALPVSAFLGLQQQAPARRRREPRCNHISMTRLYDKTLRCGRCMKRNKFGWLYRCTADREILLQEAKGNNVEVAFDAIGEAFSEHMSLGKYGPDARSDKFSFLKEITAEQMQTYTPIQIHTILTQRENVQKTIAESRKPDIEPPPGIIGTCPPPVDGKPWIPMAYEECQTQVCGACYAHGKDKSWLSLDGIVNGHIPPTAATAFSFSHTQKRPMSDPEVVKNLGYRAVPIVRQPEWLASPSSLCSSNSDWGTIGAADEDDGTVSLAHHHGKSDEDKEAERASWSAFTVTARLPSNQTFDLLGMSTPTPIPGDLASESPIDEVASNISLMIELAAREAILPTVNGLLTVEAIPYPPEGAYGVELSLPVDQKTFHLACRTALPKPSFDEKFFFYEEMTSSRYRKNY